MNPRIDHGSFIVELLRSVGGRLRALLGATDRAEPVRPVDDELEEEDCDDETLRRLGITEPGIYAISRDDIAGPCENVEVATEAWLRKYGARRLRFVRVESTTQHEGDPSPCGSDVRDCNTDDTACKPTGSK